MDGDYCGLNILVFAFILNPIIGAGNTPWIFAAITIYVEIKIIPIRETIIRDSHCGLFESSKMN